MFTVSVKAHHERNHIYFVRKQDQIFPLMYATELNSSFIKVYGEYAH